MVLLQVSVTVKLADGLQHGNSPLEYSPILSVAKYWYWPPPMVPSCCIWLDNNADTIISGSFPNLSSVCKYLVQQNKNVVMGCAGWKDRYNLEDTLFAGAVISRVKKKNILPFTATARFTAELLYDKHKNDSSGLCAQPYPLPPPIGTWFGLIEISVCLTPDMADVLVVYEDGKLVKK